MKRIEEIKIQNYRGLDDLEFKPKMINIFVGRNNAGKSSVLNAIFLNLLGLHEYRKRSANLVTNISNLLVKPLKYELFYDHQEGYIELQLLGDTNNSIHTRLDLKYNLEGWPEIIHPDAFKDYLDKTVKKGMMYNEVLDNLYQSTLFFDYSINQIPVLSSFVPTWKSVKIFDLKRKREIDVYDSKEQANSRKYFDEITKYYGDTKSVELDSEQFYQVPTIFWRNNPQGSLKEIYQDLVKNARIGKALESMAEKANYFKDLRYIDDEFIVSLEDDLGNNYSLPLIVMGDGFKSLISLIFLFSRIDEGIILLEEPENFLHPGYIDLLCEEIVSKSAECQLFFTTHSLNLVSQLVDKLEAAGKMDSVMLIRMRREGKGIDREFLYKEDIMEELHEIEIDLRGY